MGGKQKFPWGSQAIFYGIHLHAQYPEGFGEDLKHREGYQGRGSVEASHQVKEGGL